MADNKKNFVFTNEGKFDAIIFDRLHNELLDSWNDDDTYKMLQVTLQYFTIVPRGFHGVEKRKEIRNMFTEIKIPRECKSKIREERLKYTQQKQDANAQIWNIWEEISDGMDRRGYFKKTFTIEDTKEEDRSGLQQG